jgi:hypothetical protein
MAVTRVFRVRIHPDSRAQFAPKFADISVRAVTDRLGGEGVTIHGPKAWTRDEYCMVSRWDDEAAAVSFAGEDWNQAVISPGMERYVAECWGHHYRDWQGQTL